MKYCPQCNKQYSEAWLTFCTDDGSVLREDLTPAADPNWDPRIRETKYDDPSEQQTQWLPPDVPPASGWMAADEPKPVERPWQPPPEPERPWPSSSPAAEGPWQPSQSAPIDRPWQPSSSPAPERPWQPPPPPPQPYTRQGPPGIAVASLVVGIIGVMMGLLCAVPIPGIIAVILGIVALVQMKANPNPTGRGLAIAGIVLGSANLAFFLFAILWAVLSVAFG